MRKKLLSLILVFAMAFTVALPTYADTATGSLALTSTTIGLKPGESAGLFAADNSVAVTLTSANPAIASVSDNMITGVSFGRTTVTATAADGRTATCDIHVAYKGVDVSSHNGKIAWTDLKNNGVDFAIIRTGYGDELPAVQTDSQFVANYNGAVANGIKVGVYHYSYATSVAQAIREAQFCLSILNNRHLDYPVFYDVEDKSIFSKLTTAQISAMAAAFCRTITNAGYRAGIYSGARYLTNLNTPELSAYDKWVAHYDVDSASYTGPYSIWQFSSKGGIAGANGNLDFDYCYQTYPLPAQQSASDSSMTSDTGATLSMKKGKSYTFKFTPSSTSSTPSFSTGNSKVLKVSSVTKWKGSYLVKVTATGKGCTSVYSTFKGQQAVRRCVVTVS
ncbi:GH25 family lysozyme [Caproiciproducens sp. LBM24188]